MADMLMTEEAVKDFLHIKDFRNVGKGDVIKMVSNLHRMDPLVAIKCIDQFPNYADSTAKMINNLADTCNKAISAGNEETKIILESYSKSLERLTEMYEDNEITPEEKEIISKTIVYLGQQILEHRQLAAKERLDILTKLGGFALGAVAILGTAIGVAVNVNTASLPSFGNNRDQDD